MRQRACYMRALALGTTLRVAGCDYRPPPIPTRAVSYDDLMELARLYLRQADATNNPAAAPELKRLASEYQARAAALGGGGLVDIAAAYEAAAPTTQALQQQQPQPEGQGDGEGEKPPGPTRNRDDV
jgi:hypothetical protein